MYDIQYITHMEKENLHKIILIHINKLYIMYEMQYTVKIFIPAVFNQKKLLTLSPENSFPQEQVFNSTRLAGITLITSQKWYVGEQLFELMELGFKVLGGNIMFFHEIIKVSTVFSG